MLKWPLDWREVEFTCLEESKRAFKSAGNANRQFADEELIALSVGDKDPNRPIQHLVDSIHQINALSSFLQSCAEERDSREQASSALLEACTDTSWARAYLESALQNITNAQHESAEPLTQNPSASGQFLPH